MQLILIKSKDTFSGKKSIIHFTTKNAKQQCCFITFTNCWAFKQVNGTRKKIKHRGWLFDTMLKHTPFLGFIMLTD